MLSYMYTYTSIKRSEFNEGLIHVPTVDAEVAREY